MFCKNVLVVDDETDIRFLFRTVLKRRGYQVYEAGNGREALDLLPHIEYPSLVVLDIMMPVMNGLDFLEAKRHDSAIAALPVVVVSAICDEVQDESVVLCMKKPIDMQHLLSVVEQYCEQPTPAAAAAAKKGSPERTLEA